MSEKEKETEEGLMRRAYSLGLKLKNSGLEEEIIYARLEKQGIPEELAMQVARDVMIERQKSEAEDEKSHYDMTWIKIGLGLLLALISAIVLPGMIVIPIGLIIGGLVYAIATKD